VELNYLRGMQAAQLYDTIGVSYTTTRQTEPRIAAQIWAALGDARTVLNVGAGTGSYEPPGREVIAVEPSAVMRAQRQPDAAPCLSARADSLPFADQSFDAAMAVLSDHHWPDPVAGLREMRRVARRVVVFQFDVVLDRCWLTRDYLPEFADLQMASISLDDRAAAIGATMQPVLVPWDCADGFFYAYWRRPEEYLDVRVRRGISVFSLIAEAAEQRFVQELGADLRSGRWAERNGELLRLAEADLGGRLLVA
jgi:SAM-dependent methyltransferase